jgi:hypothetical protein
MSAASSNQVVRLVVDDVAGHRHQLLGREAWAAAELIRQGAAGCTPIDNPAPRWSHYIYLLRRRGFDIETVHEAHGGAYSGHHARYVLRCALQVVSVVRSGEARDAAA